MPRRGFSSPGFDQGKQSEFDAAVEAMTAILFCHAQFKNNFVN